MNEATLQESCSKLFNEIGPRVFLEKRWGGGVYAPKGVSDYVGVAFGFPVAIELKHPVTRPPLNDDQIAYQDRFKAAGGYTLVAYSLSAVILFLQDLAKRADSKHG
jgi:hypothetical protein